MQGNVELKSASSFLIRVSEVCLLIHLHVSLNLIKYTKNPFFREELEVQIGRAMNLLPNISIFFNRSAI